MKLICSMLALAGFASLASAQALTLLKYEVSRDGLNWASGIDASPSETIEVRARVIYQGSAPIGGLSQITFQPVVNNWQGLDFTGNGPTRDNVVVQIQGTITNSIGRIGGTRTTPIGSVDGLPGEYGRVTPFASAATNNSNYYRGFVGTGTNAGLMRISSAHITNWIGDGPTSGAASINNFSGRGGVITGQIAGRLRVSTDPAFETRTDVVVFKFGITLSDSASLRTLNITTPVNAIGRRLVNDVPTELDVTWYDNNFDTLITRGGADVMDGFINVVPTPGAASLIGVAGLAIACRRRARAS